MLNSLRISSGCLPLIMLALRQPVPRRNVHCLAANVKQALDVKVVGREDNFKEHLLIDLDELGIPLRDVGRTAAHLIRVVRRHRRVVAVVATVLEHLRQLGPTRVRSTHLGQHTRRHVRQRDRLIRLANILNHLLDQH